VLEAPSGKAIKAQAENLSRMKLPIDEQKEGTSYRTSGNAYDIQ
jgi:hypothetical protein